MQVDVSMYLATVGTVRMPERLPRTDAEERRISRLCAIALLPQAFSSFTRKVLNSGVQVLGSIAEGVRKFARGPVWPVFPAAYPQWIGKPICHISFPSIFMGKIRLVTIATPSTEPRAEETLTFEPLAIPFCRARPSGISTKKAGWSWFKTSVCLV